MNSASHKIAVTIHGDNVLTGDALVEGDASTGLVSLSLNGTKVTVRGGPAVQIAESIFTLVRVCAEAVAAKANGGEPS